jgi:hypothetical protein
MADADKSKVELAQLVRSMRENMHAHIELNQHLAKITRAKYLALIDEGFNEQQALQLCKG